jgi:hypothetical protein
MVGGNLKKLMYLIPCFIMLGCPNSGIESKARDTAAALKGVLATAQGEYLAECQTNPAQTTCTAINKGVNAQNLLITAVETYCGWPISSTPPDATATCVPVAGAKDALTAAISNANQAITEVKGVIK